jgi:hypothetical protein
VDVKRNAVAVLALLLFVTSAPLCHAEGPYGRYNLTSISSVQSKPKQSLLDFSLQQINSADRDYGWCIGQGRTVLLSETIKNSYFWSNVVCLTLMAGLFLILVFQHTKGIRDKWKLAEVVAQYEHAIFRAQPDIDQVLSDPSASDWIKRALRSAIERDPVDASNDAEVLARVLGNRCRQILAD